MSTAENTALSITVNPAGPRLYLGSSTSGAVGSVAFADEDILIKNMTTGARALYFDGSDVGLSNTSDEDVNGVSVDAVGKIYASTLGNFSVTGVGGDGSDVFVCTPGSLGTTTTNRPRLAGDA